MKTLAASVVSLLLGLVAGWYVEHSRAERAKTAIIQQMIQADESTAGEHTARAIRAIELVESGQPLEAVQVLSTPVARFYSQYSGAGGDEQRAKLRALIEQLAKTNQTVAARIAEASTNHSLKIP